MDSFQRSKLPLQATVVKKGISETDEFETDARGWEEPREELEELGVTQLLLQSKENISKN